MRTHRIPAAAAEVRQSLGDRCHLGKRLATHREEVRAPPQDGRLRFERARRLDEDIASLGIVPALDEVGQDPARAFDAVQSLDLESRRQDLAPELFRSMKVRRREVVEPVRSVLMLPIEQIALDDPRELAVAQ